MSQRRSLSKKLRFQILERDNFACRYCGRGAPEYRLAVDHVMPVALGGSNHPSNLVAACAACNHGKAANMLDASSADRPGLMPLPSQTVRYLDFASRVAAIRWSEDADDPTVLYELMVGWHLHLKIPADLIVDIAMTAPKYTAAYGPISRYRRETGLDTPETDRALRESIREAMARLDAEG